MLFCGGELIMVEEAEVPERDPRPSVGKLTILVNKYWSRAYLPSAGFELTT